MGRPGSILARGSSIMRADGGTLANTRIGQVIFRSSREVIVLIGEERIPCELRGLLRRRGSNAVVVGDRVEVISDGPDRGRVEDVLPRDKTLSRRRESGRGRELVIAANVHQVVAMLAARQPRPKLGALDRLLVAAASSDLAATIVLNKVDLGVPPDIDDALGCYAEMGYPVVKTSRLTGEGLAQFEEVLAGKTTVVSGPSGVGKSSLIAPIIGVDLRVGDVSRANEKGRHTTTAVTWYPLRGAGAVLDTPGFRDYALWGLPAEELAECFPEFRPFLGSCHFTNCLHREEPRCAIQDAAKRGELDPRRYHSYLGILQSILEQDPTRG